jgi:gliding motility-associated-like protein
MKLKIGIAFLLLCATYVLAHAQPYPSRDGNFQVDQIKGCAPLTVNVIVSPTLCGPGLPCEFFYEGDPIQNVFTHQYTQPGTYTLIVLFQDIDVTDRIQITVLPNTIPEFEIYSCGGNSVQVNVTDTNYNQYVINYNDGSPDVVVPSGSMAKDTHTFAASGNKTVTVRGRNLGADDNCSQSSKVVNAVSSLPVPTITQLIVLNDRDIQLDFNTQPNILYRLQIAQNSSSNFQNLQNIYGATTATINNLRPDDNYYCFRLGVFDPCNNTTVYSNTICSSNFDVTALNNINHLSWLTSQVGISNYSFTKNSDPPLSASATATSLDDTNITCGAEYCYQQTTNYANGSRSISLSKCATAISTDIPTVVENISTVVSEQKEVHLEWTQDPEFLPTLYTITKTVNGTFATTNTSTTPTFVDDAYLLDVTSCYKINYVDACNNKSPVSIEACPILLVGTLQSDNAISLSWNEYVGWKNGVHHYVVEKFSGSGQLLLTVNTNDATTYLDDTQDLSNQIVFYRITAIPNQAGVRPSSSNTITIIKEPNLFYPTAFTPNNDGLNDVFNVFGQFITTFEMRIFNRWGEMMYSTEDLEKGWDGHFKGTLMPEGTYVFRANITDQAGRTFERSGTILLLKKD